MLVTPIAESNPQIGLTSRQCREAAAEFVNLKDADIQNIALLNTANMVNDKKFNRKTKILYASTPLAAGLSAALLQSGKLSEKVLAGSKKFGIWGASLLVLSAYNAVENAVVSRSKTLQKFRENNPLLSTATSVGGALGTYKLAEFGFNKGYNLVRNNRGAQKMFGKINNVISNAAKKLDLSKAQTKLMPKISTALENFAKKAPSLSSAGLAVVSAAPFIMLMAGVLKCINHAKKKNQIFADNYYDLKTAQLQTSKDLAYSLLAENEILKR